MEVILAVKSHFFELLPRPGHYQSYLPNLNILYALIKLS